MSGTEQWRRNQAAAVEAAAAYLTIHGCRVLDRNWCPDDVATGLQLIADHGGLLVGVDLRVHKKQYGRPLEQITQARARIMRGLLARWAKEHGLRYDIIHIDVIGVLGDVTSGAATIEHVRGVA
jgi:Holliday junction resolvase-like predicted endonuclease